MNRATKYILISALLILLIVLLSLLIIEDYYDRTSALLTALVASTMLLITGVLLIKKAPNDIEQQLLSNRQIYQRIGQLVETTDKKTRDYVTGEIEELRKEIKNQSLIIDETIQRSGTNKLINEGNTQGKIIGLSDSQTLSETNNPSFSQDTKSPKSNNINNIDPRLLDLINVYESLSSESEGVSDEQLAQAMIQHGTADSFNQAITIIHELYRQYPQVVRTGTSRGHHGTFVLIYKDRLP